MRSSLLVALMALAVVTACSRDTTCPPGEDCRWLLDTPSLGLWFAADPVAVVVRLGSVERRDVSISAIWERCDGERCPWAPPGATGRLVRQDDGVWVVSLTRSASAREPAGEVVLPLPDGSRVRFGLALGREEAPVAVASDLPTCVDDLRASLAAGGGAAEGAVLDTEIELACLIWLHPEQSRSAMRWHPTLHQIARDHACDMAERDYFGHTDPEGRGPNDRARRAGYALPPSYDDEDDANNIESLALRGPISSPTLTLEQWLASALHRPHVLGATDFKARQDETATGYCRGHRDGIDLHYWVFVSAQPAP